MHKDFKQLRDQVNSTGRVEPQIQDGRFFSVLTEIYPDQRIIIRAGPAPAQYRL